MLARLAVRNLAVLEEAEVFFGPGLNIITGETGSGKSVLKGALALALGARADASAVREGAAEAVVEAEFALSGAPLETVSEILAESGLPPCEDGALVIRRTVGAGGGGRTRVNDASATARTLRRLGLALADLHGPEDSAALAGSRTQLALLDAWGGTPLEAYTTQWRRLRAAEEELESLNGGTEGLEAEAEALRWAVAEIDDAALSPEDDGESLAARHAAAAHAAEIVEETAAAIAALDGDAPGSQSAAGALIEASSRAAAMARFFPEAAEWQEAANALVVQVQELSRAMACAASKIDADPSALDALDARISLVKRLERKYAPTVEGILRARDQKAARLAEIEGRAERAAALAGERDAAAAAVRKEGETLTRARRKSAAALSEKITAALRGLGFAKSFFSVSVESAAPGPSGCDNAVFLFGPNPGEPARPLGAIASSGEMARVLLAAESVLAEHDSTPVLFFDEIDSNIGGETGRAVGERLRETARHRQVIAITHLPQSAVFGARHLAVSKSVEGGRTRARVTLLEGERRVEEITRMLGGEGASSMAGAHARELLASACKSS